jgi:hypothetical protein
MQRLFAFLLLSLYLFFSGSKVLSMHYCGGTLAETRINAQASCCCEDVLGNNNGCCEDSIKPIKHPDTFVYSAWCCINQSHEALLPPFHGFNNNFHPILFVETPTLSAGYHPPDKARPLAAYLQFHALLLYA